MTTTTTTIQDLTTVPRATAKPHRRVPPRRQYSGKCGEPNISFSRPILRQITDLSDRRWHPGTLRRQTRVRGGAQVPVGALPWAASVRHGTVTCGGTLIGPYFVVTAAHCLTNGTGENVNVKVRNSSKM